MRPCRSVVLLVNDFLLQHSEWLHTISQCGALFFVIGLVHFFDNYEHH